MNGSIVRCVSIDGKLAVANHRPPGFNGRFISFERARLASVCSGRDVVCYRRLLSHNQVDICKKHASSVEYR